MRSLTDAAKLDALMDALGSEVSRPARIYLTGGATAVLFAWRSSTVDVDLTLDPDHDEIYRAIARLKERLEINIELASPAHFIPELPGWQDRSQFIRQAGPLAFYHYDFYSQCLSKIERGHAKDVDDAREMLARGLVERQRLRELFEAIEPKLYRYPAINADKFRRAVDIALLS